MRPIQRDEIIGIGEYERVRPHFRARVIEEKKARRVAFGEFFSVLFENRDTVLLQIQEMLRTERITAEAGVAHEIETYNDLIPGDAELSLTLFLEIPDAELRTRKLHELALLERHLFVEVDGERARAVGEDREDAAERTTAVHYLKVKLSPEAARRLRAGEAKTVAVVVDHPKLVARGEAPAELVRALGAELAETS